MGNSEKMELPAYLCPWAFELLRTRRALVGLDFRTMIIRFSEQFGSQRGGRCFSNPPRPCPGTGSQYCHRFQDPEIVDKDPAHFAHDAGCSIGRCTRILWDEISYLELEAGTPRAVDISGGPSETVLRYRQGGRNTLAIFHVWRHGQGGRPEQGLNACLRRRYCAITRSHRCDSYWIDTARIPEDDTELKKRLHTEAILKINDVFETSKVTLVCDKDLMEISTGQRPTVQQWKTLIACLLLSDWNILAWTLLEAVRGSKQLHLLTRNNMTVDFQAGVRMLCNHGALDLVVLLSATSHLFPTQKFFHGFEEVGHVLSHRNTSRPGDDVLI